MKKPKGCRAWRRSRRAGRPEEAVALEGRAPCRPIYAGRSPAPIRPTKPRLRAGKMGADGASPSRLSIGAPAPRSWYIGGTTSVSSDSRGAQPRLIPADKAALSRGKNGRRRSIALQVFDRRSRAAFVGILEGRPLRRPIFARLSLAPFLKNPPCAGARENHGLHGGRPSSWGWLGSYAVGEFRNWRMANSAAAAASGTRWCCMAKPWGIFWPM